MLNDSYQIEHVYVSNIPNIKKNVRRICITVTLVLLLEL